MTDMGKTITIVSGLPRSGTSMMMKMLEAGGMQILTDNLRTADEDNPKGYYEFEAVKQLDESQDWLPAAQGKVVKIISQLLKPLPQGYEYKVIFMRRKMEEILASQKQMLIRRGEPTDAVSDETIAGLFQKHLSQIEAWLAEQSNFDVLYIHYSEAIDKPAEAAEQINEFLGGKLSIEKMNSVVDKSLHRQRS